MNSPKKVAGGGSRLRRDVASLRSNSNHPITQKRRCPGQAEAFSFINLVRPKEELVRCYRIATLLGLRM